MTDKLDLSANIAIDVQSMTQLKVSAKQNTPASVHAAAEQFEALFLSQMLSEMRKASLAEGIGDSSEQKTYLSMLDQQLAQKIAHSKGIGLADLLARQMMPREAAAAQPAAAAAPSAALQTAAQAAYKKK